MSSDLKETLVRVKLGLDMYVHEYESRITQIKGGRSVENIFKM